MTGFVGGFVRPDSNDKYVWRCAFWGHEYSEYVNGCGPCYDLLGGRPVAVRYVER